MFSMSFIGLSVYGVWCMVYSVWCMVYGVWCMGNVKDDLRQKKKLLKKVHLGRIKDIKEVV